MGKPKTIEKSKQYVVPNLAFAANGNYYMAKGKFILSIVALFAIIGGALATKVRYTDYPVMTTTTRVAFYGTFYTLPGGAAFCYPSESLFFTDGVDGDPAYGVWTTTAIPHQVYTLRRAGGTETIYIPNFCTVTALTTTRVTTID